MMKNYFLDRFPSIKFVDVSSLFEPLKGTREKLYQLAKLSGKNRRNLMLIE